MKYLLVINNSFKMKKYIISQILTIFLLYPAIAQDIPERPVPPKLVNDMTGFFSPNEVAQLEKKLVWFNQQTSTQIAIIAVKDLQGYDISDFAFRLGDKWGVGQKGFNNGIVILIKPKTPEDKGRIFIAPGYGLEAVVPDAIAKRIVEVEILPEFRKNNYYKGIDNAINTLFALTKGEFSPKEYAQQTSQNGAPAFGIGGFFLLIILFSIFGHLQRARHYSVGHSVPFWTAMFLAGSLRPRGGGFSNFSSGSGSFGGFGGGGFGGGGAGGSW
jgi:uncharacterized protein